MALSERQKHAVHAERELVDSVAQTDNDFATANAGFGIVEREALLDAETFMAYRIWM